MTPDGVGEVLDFMPVIQGGPTDRHRLVRQMRVARGQMKFVIESFSRGSTTAGPSPQHGYHGHGRCVPHCRVGMELTLHISGCPTGRS